VNEPSRESADHDVSHDGPNTPSASHSAGGKLQDVEVAIAELRDATCVNGSEHDPHWAELKVQLGGLYLKRRLGAKAENLNIAIQCYRDALTAYERQSHPKEWTICHRQLGRTYLELSDGHNRLLKHLSRVHYEMALVMISRDRWPELWHVIHLELAVLFRKYSQSPEDEDARLSDDHNKTAFELDRDEWPETYDLMRRSFDLHLKSLELQCELRSADQRTLPPRENRT
jgi:hypothetical protein